MNRTALINATIGEYRIVDMLGAGGMGEVYRAVHSKIGRVVAIKVLSQAVHSPQFLERFLNEARIQASLQHPNIATLYDFLEYNGQPCIIMEYIEGQTLTDRIKMCGALPLADALAIFHTVVEALAYVHMQGIVHRDIKSNNIKIGAGGQVKLLDFGIAKSGASPQLTQAGGFIGTLQYLSPEQFKGGNADARSDIWALGVLLYEMITGHLPFEANTIGELYEKVSSATFTPPSALIGGVPPSVEAIIARCLKKNPADRYQSARELLIDVERARGSASAPLIQPQPAAMPPGYAPGYQPGYATAPAVAMRTQPDTPAAPQKKKGALAAGGAVAAVLLVGAMGAGAYFLLNDDSPSTPAANGNAPVSNLQRRGAAGQQSEERVVKIEVLEGVAEVHQDGKLLGKTPYDFQVKPGQQLKFTLKRDGYEDKPVEITVSDNRKVYTFMMSKRE